MLILTGVLLMALLGTGGLVVVTAMRKRDDDLLDGLIMWEGLHDYLYQDSLGYVTTGIGNLVKTADAATKLDWIDSAGNPASEALVRSDWLRVAGASSGHAASYYEPLSQCRLPEGGAQSLARARLNAEFIPALEAQFPNFDDLPVPARRVLIDMIYNLGAAGLAKFTNLHAAVAAADWERAAVASHVSTSRDTRNDWRAAQFRSIAGSAVA